MTTENEEPTSISNEETENIFESAKKNTEGESEIVMEIPRYSAEKFSAVEEKPVAENRDDEEKSDENFYNNTNRFSFFNH